MDLVCYNRFYNLDDKQKKDLIKFICPSFSEDELNFIIEYENLYHKLINENEENVNKKLSLFSFMSSPKSLLKNEIDPNFRRPISVNGYQIDQVKSGIQKYIRRGNFDKAAFCAIEMDLFSDFEIKYPKSLDSSSKSVDKLSIEYRKNAVRTNMFHRLLVIASEDISIANPTLPEHFNRLVKVWMNTRESILNSQKKKIDVENFNKGMQIQRVTLLKMIKMLCESPKSRFFSYLRTVWWKKMNKPYIKKHFPKILEAPKFEKDEIKYKYKVNEDENKKFKKWMKKLCFYTEQKHDKAYKYILNLAYLPKKEKLENKVMNHISPVYLVWDYIFKNSEKILGKELNNILKPSINALLEWFKEAPSEGALYVAQSLTYLIRRDEIKKLIIDNKINYDFNYKEIYSKNLQNKKIKLDEYVIDMHTKSGRDTKSNKFFFVFQGALTNNEVKSLVNDDYRLIYGSLAKYYVKEGKGQYKKEYIKETGPPLTIQELNKLEKEGLERDFNPPKVNKGKEEESSSSSSDNESEEEDESSEEDIKSYKKEKSYDSEKDVFSNIVRAQLLCAKQRPDVYFATYNNPSKEFPYKDVVVKYPYINKDNLDAMIYIGKEKEKYKGINPIPFEIIELYPMSDKEMENPPDFGSRTKIDLNKKYKAHVSKNVCSIKGGEIIPYKIKSSKLWPDTKVADLEKMGSINGSIELVPSSHHLDLLLVLIFRWMYEVVDTCERNIIFCNNKIYGLDEEGYKSDKTLESFYNKPLGDGEVGSRKKKLFIKAIEKNWDKIQEYLEEWKKVKKPEWVQNNLEKIKNKEFLINLL